MLKLILYFLSNFVLILNFMIHKCSFYPVIAHLFSKGGQGNMNGNMGHGGGSDANDLNDAAAQFLEDRATENG